MNGYGQIYRTWCEDWGRGSVEYPYGMAFRGYLYQVDEATGKHVPVWKGFPVGTPDEAFEHMERMSKEFGLDDLRPWSGTLPEEPKVKIDEA